MSELGALAVSLGKARLEFPTIKRSKTVTTPKYTFDYAPLDQILEAVTGPLAKHGLVVIQTIDDGALVTTLLHESGASFGGRIDLPATDSIQSLGSAITYLRRYAIQAVLGIAPEEDDDGSRGSGIGGAVRDRVSEPMSANPEERLALKGEITRKGKVAKGQGRHSDLQYRQTPDGYHVGFRLEIEGGKAIPQVVAQGPLGLALYTAGGELLGQTIEVTGDLFEVQAPRRQPYFRLVATRIVADEWTVPAADISEAESEAIWNELEAVGA